MGTTNSSEEGTSGRKGGKVEHIMESLILPRAKIKITKDKHVIRIMDLIRLNDAEVLAFPPPSSKSDDETVRFVSNHEEMVPIIGLFKVPEEGGDGPPLLNKLVLYFPGNDEDPESTLSALNMITRRANAPAIALCYPNYDLPKAVMKMHPAYESFAAHNPTSPESNMALTRMHGIGFIRSVMDITKLSPFDIIPVGFSIGTGVLCHAMKHFKDKANLTFSAVSLHSPFADLTETAAAMALKYMSYTSPSPKLIASARKKLEDKHKDELEHWDSVNNLKACPETQIFLFHCPQDKTIPIGIGAQSIASQLKVPEDQCTLNAAPPKTLKTRGYEHAFLSVPEELYSFVSNLQGLNGTTDIQRALRRLQTTVTITKYMSVQMMNRKGSTTAPTGPPAVLRSATAPVLIQDHPVSFGTSSSFD